MTKKSFNLRNTVKSAVAVLAVALMSSGAMAQTGYAGNYSGTLTVTPAVCTMFDINNINTEIQNQRLEVYANRIFFPAIPIFKTGDPSNIGFINVAFASDGSFSAPAISSDDDAITFTLVSGNVSGDNIALAFRITDKATNGMTLDATVNYTGTKQVSGIAEVRSAAAPLKVFPNPANSTLNVELEKSTNGTLALFDMNGKIVANQSINGTRAQINLSGFAPGTYILRLVENGQASAGVQVVKE
jgi:hypothetical protein